MPRTIDLALRCGVVSGLIVVLLAPRAVAQVAPEATPVPLWGPNSLTYAVARTGETLAIGGSFDYVGPPTGSLAILDTTTGEVVGNPGFQTVDVRHAITDGAGGWFVTKGGVVHLLPDGRVDEAWVSPTFTGGALGTLYGLARDGGRLFVAGAFEAAGGQARAGLAALDAGTGALLPWSIAIDAAVGTPAVGSMVFADGLLYISGSFTTVGGAARRNIAVIDAATAAVTSFVNDTISYVQRLRVTSSRVYVVGQCENTGTPAGVGLCALDRASGARLTWQPAITQGIGLRDAVATETEVVIPADDPSTSRRGVASFDASTGAERWFQRTDGDVSSLDHVGGRIFAAGRFRTADGATSSSVAVFDLATGAVRSLALTDAVPDTIATDGTRVLVGGLLLNSVGGIRQKNLVFIDLTTGRPSQVVPAVEFPVHAMTVVGSSVIVGGDSAWTSRNLAAVSTATGQVFALDLGTDGDIMALATDGQRLFLGGTFRLVGLEPRQHLAAIDLATLETLPWDPRPDGYVTKLRVSSGALYVMGYFQSFPGYGRGTAAAFDIDTGALLPWNVQSNGFVSDLGFWRDRVLVAGSFTSVAGQPRAGLVWVDRISGAPVSVETALPDFRPQAVARTGDTLVLGGYGPGGLQARAIDASTGRALPWTVRANGPLGGGLFVAEGYADLVAMGGVLWEAGGRPVMGVAVFKSARAGAPVRRTATVSGSTVTLGWTPGLAPTATSFIVEAGTASGLADVGTFGVGTARTVSSTLPPGTYFTRVRGVGASGPGAASSEVIVTVPATSAAPAAPGALTASISAGIVKLEWGAASGNATSYVVEAGTATGVTNVGTFSTGHLDTTFTTPAPPGTYFVRVRAANVFGHSAPSNEVAIVVP